MIEEALAYLIMSSLFGVAGFAFGAAAKRLVRLVREKPTERKNRNESD